MGLSIECSVPPTWGGIRLHSKELITLGAGQCAHMRTEGPCHWGGIWLPVQEFTRYSGALTGTAIEVPPGVCRWQPRSGPERQFRRLYLAAIRTTHARSGPVIGAEAAHGLEQQLIHLLVECLSSEPASLAAPTMRRGLDVMARFEELIRNRPEGNLSVPHIKAALGVSDRLLRKYSAEHLGMSPMSYVRLHRMQLANHTLRLGTPQTTRVADVAKRFGFGNLGRFAGAYRELYGELPFETLRHPPHRGVPAIALHNRFAGANPRDFD